MMIYIHSDHLNTPKVVTDENQVVVWRADHQPFGEVTETVATVEMPLRFSGQYQDDESGLSYNYHRSYDPNTGRYTQSDPIGAYGGLNLHGYANQNPLRYIDPFGLDTMDCFKIALTGEISFSECFMDEEIKKPFERKVKEVAEAAKCGLKCSATCTAEFFIGEIADQALEHAAKEAVKRAATGAAQKLLLRGMPIVGYVSTINSLRVSIKCVTSCWAN